MTSAPGSYCQRASRQSARRDRTVRPCYEGEGTRHERAAASRQSRRQGPRGRTSRRRCSLTGIPSLVPSAHVSAPQAWAPAALAARRIVCGDYGTCPLYTLGVAARIASRDRQVAPDAVRDVVSLILGALIVV